jgi:hypothetical protein
MNVRQYLRLACQKVSGSSCLADRKHCSTMPADGLLLAPDQRGPPHISVVASLRSLPRWRLLAHCGAIVTLASVAPPQLSTGPCFAAAAAPRQRPSARPSACPAAHLVTASWACGAGRTAGWIEQSSSAWGLMRCARARPCHSGPPAAAAAPGAPPRHSQSRCETMVGPARARAPSPCSAHPCTRCPAAPFTSAISCVHMHGIAPA